MAEGINLTGLVEVKVQLAIPGTLDKLGESLDMADVEDRAFWHNVPGDRYGGPQGPPIEVQYLGSMMIVRMELSRWDPVVYDELKKRQVNATAGTIIDGEVGDLMLEANSFRLLLDSPARALNFPAVLLRDSISFAMGTKFSALALQFECHRCQDGTARDDILYDDTETVYT